MPEGMFDIKKLFSNAANNVKPSPVRELFHFIKRPGMISFAGGMPAPEVFPVDKFYEGAHLLKDDAKDLLQYSPTMGNVGLREYIAEFCAQRLGRKVDVDEILLTSGSQQALDLIGWALLDKGDLVITEDPTYMAALNSFYNHGADFISVPCDGQGMQVEMLPGLIEKARADGKKVKFIYSIVNFQNPGGMTMSVERRKRLAEISAQYDVPIFEDDPYGYVRFEGDHLPSIFSFDKKGNTLYAGSFSKILAPGTRIGWIIADKELLKKMTGFKESIDVCSCPISQALVLDYCKKGYMDQHLPVIIANYKIKRDAMEQSMQKHLAPLGVTWVKPEGGFFFWIDVPGINTTELFHRAIEQKVAFVIGTAFTVKEEAGINKARLNYTFCQPDIIEEGISRLAKAIQEMQKEKS